MKMIRRYYKAYLGTDKPVRKFAKALANHLGVAASDLRILPSKTTYLVTPTGWRRVRFDG